MSRRGPGYKNEQQKAKNFKWAMLKLLKQCRPFAVPIIVAFVLASIASILSIIGPDKLKEITNILSSGIQSSVDATVASGTETNTPIDLDAIANCGIFLVIIYAASFLCHYAEHFLMVTVVNRFSQKLRQQISTKINRLPLKYFDNTTVGDVLSRITNDVDTISESMNESISTLVSAVTLFVGALVMMFITNWTLAIAAIVASLLGFGLMTLILSRSQKYFTRYQNQLGIMNGHVEESFSGHNVIKAYNAEKEINQRFDEINLNLFKSGRYSQFYSGMMMPIMGFVGNLGYVVVCVLGSVLVVNGMISFGVVVAFMIYVRLFTQPLNQFASTLTELQSTAAASERVFTFLGESEMANEHNLPLHLDANKVHGDVMFDHVRFGYDPKTPIIKDFSADIKAGQKIAIVGPTGAGKTTLVNLLMKFYQIDAGDIRVDNVSINDITRANVHELFTMVLQDTWLFEGTVNDNIRYNKKDVSDKEIRQACQTIGLDHFIRSLSRGYDTVLGDSEGLSAGQKQLLTIARAMVDNSPLLILDEATSSVDTRTEEMIQRAMDKLTKGRTSFVIAHRLSTIKNADTIFVMKDGNIIEQGDHETLMHKKGFYADLYNSQFAEG